MSDRPVTPYKPFDSRSKIAIAAAAPPDPFEGIPRIPRAPHVPSDVGDLDSLGAAEAHDTEITPPDGPFAIRKVLKKLDQLGKDNERLREEIRDVKELLRSSGTNDIQMFAMVQALTGEVDAVKRRMNLIEVSDRWMPRIAWAVTFLISVFALARTYH